MNLFDHPDDRDSAIIEPGEDEPDCRQQQGGVKASRQRIADLMIVAD
jgi:hypothetical protein